MSQGNLVSPAPDDAFQNGVLPGVSRTFALTIPQLPAGLRDVVTNGYLLCRLADTIEDERDLDEPTRQRFQLEFPRVVAGEADARNFAAELATRLSASTPPAEHELVGRLPRVIEITRGFPRPQRDALERCVRTMCEGMSHYGPLGRGSGLANLDAHHEYCYYVAGVVGEMLTELFCSHSPAIAANREGLRERTVSFGQGLQMTNILKDVWEDLDRGCCWLPRDVFLEHGFDLADLSPGRGDREGFELGMRELIGVALGHLEDALDYTLLIPARERGIRHFCLWALGMAVLTLRKIHKHLDFRSGREVKITRRSVRGTVLISNLLTGRDRLLRATFRLCSAGLPRPVPTPSLA